MKQQGRLIKLRRYWFDEPSIWMLRCFFQPAGFKKDIETDNLRQRLWMMCRLSVPMFIGSFPLALALRVVLYMYNPSLYPPFSFEGFAIFAPDVALFVLDAIWATAISCLATGLFGGLFGIAYGIAFGIAAGVANGIVIDTQEDALVAIVSGLTFGIMLGLSFNSSWSLKRGGIAGTTLSATIGVVAGIIGGVIIGIVGGYWAGALIGLIGGSAMQTGEGPLGSIAGLFVGTIGGCLLLKLIGTIVHASLRRNTHIVDTATKIGIAVAGAFGMAVGDSVGDLGMHFGGIADGFSLGLSVGLIACSIFLLSFIPSYYRLPLYPLSSIAMVRTYFYCQRDPAHILQYLRRSALHCDECVFLPLPYVKHMLLLASEQSVPATLEEIDFIIQERPQQSGGALAATLEMALYDLSMCANMRDLAGAYVQLNVLLPPSLRLTYPRSARLFRYIEDASRDAASYFSRANRQARAEALESMVANLKRVHPSVAFKDGSLNKRLEEVIQKWLGVIQHEQDTLLSSADQYGYIDNPYVPGLVLELRDPLFVGRRDLAQQLGDALRKSRRPTFFLTGERRMGKSSVLKQLPGLLGSHYLPVFYDLQNTGIASNIAALLAAIAEGVYELLSAKGLSVKRLEYEQLREDQRENEAVVYHRFNRWLRDIERLLEKDDRTLLLAFDEFEKLEEAAQKGYIDLKALLDWFRSVIQNRPRLALLFSGVKTVSDMGTNWSGYFVNVETLKVSFLRQGEAEQLILCPTALFPGTQIFVEEVIDEIITSTGGHPFLIQALCSSIVTQLNAQRRVQAELEDVRKAQDELFKTWGEYFEDLWMRTDPEQRACMLVLYRACEASMKQIQQASGQEEAVCQRALQKLMKRDMLVRSDDAYRLAVPIFGEWLRRTITNV